MPPHCEIRNRGSFFFSFFSLSFSFSLYSLLLISHVVIVIASVPNTPQATFRPLNNRPAVLIVCEFPLAADLQTIVGLEGQKSTLSQLPKKALESSFFDHDKLSISFFFFFFFVFRPYSNLTLTFFVQTSYLPGAKIVILATHKDTPAALMLRVCCCNYTAVDCAANFASGCLGRGEGKTRRI